MQVQLNNIGRRFKKEWIFKNTTIELKENSIVAVEGPNGSGKSTLLKIISGSDIPSEGEVIYKLNQKQIEVENIFNYISYTAPYIDLPEQLTLMELINFHKKLKKFINSPSEVELIEKMYLYDSKDKVLKDFSSGMKQRLKLGLAILSDSDLLILDEPCSNLDHKGIEWYKQVLSEYSNKRQIFIGSNKNENETFLATTKINILDFKML